MKHIKLIKEYPNSPKLGHKVKLSNNPDWAMYQQYPEFWEEVVEEDYEILSFRQKCSGWLWTKFTNGWCRNSNGKPVTHPYSYDNILNNHLNGGIEYHIHSVKRLSDGEVFTIGDKIDGDCGSNQEIVKITEDWIYYRSNTNDCQIFTYRLENIKHSKKLLFSTEDDVDIYEGDAYYELITPSFHNKYCIWNIIDNKARGNIIYDQEGNRRNGRIWFSTREKAEEYILYNKPCLSILEVLNSQDYTHFLENKLKELVKQKLNK